MESLKAKELILGYRGKAGINMEMLIHLIVNFSDLIVELENDFESVDLNPVICSKDQCVIADARIMLQAL